MKIDSQTRAVKSIRGRILGYESHYRDLGTAREHPTRDESNSDLARMLDFRASYESARVTVAAAGGHVGVFSYDLHGYVDTRHVWPDGHVSLIGGSKTLQDAELDFRYHVAQSEWTFTASIPDYLPESKHADFRHWMDFQFRYRYATQTLNMVDRDAHTYACDTRNPLPQAA